MGILTPVLLRIICYEYVIEYRLFPSKMQDNSGSNASSRWIQPRCVGICF